MSTTRSERDYKFVCVERRERIGPNRHFWSCAIKCRGQINWFHDTSPLAVMKLAVQACRNEIAREVANELRDKTAFEDGVSEWLR